MNNRYPFNASQARLSVFRSVHAKLVFLLVTAAIVPLLTLGFFSYRHSSQIVNTQYGSYGNYAVQQMKIILDTNLRQMENITGYVLTYLVTTPILIEDGPPDTYKLYTEEKAFKSFLSSHENGNILSVNIVTPSGKVLGSDSVQADRLLQSDFWQAAADVSKKLITIHRPDYYSSTTVNYVISLVVPIQNRFGLPADSKILIDMKADDIMALFQSFESDTHSHVEIQDVSGRILLRTSSDFKPAGNDIVWRERLNSEDLIVEARMARGRFYELSDAVMKYTLWVALIALLFGLMLAGLLSYRFTRPIHKLTQSMRRFGQGELSIRTPVFTADEFGFLSESFNRMADQIRDLVQEIKNTEKRKSEAELRMLHSQINPHFLFNTINSIQWMAKLSKQTNIQKMLGHLVAVMKGSFNFTQVLVPLKDELENVRHYLEIQKYRYGEVFEFELRMDPQLRECLVPRLVFQPFLENTFFHGFIDGQGHIRLAIECSGNVMRAELTDDGMGIKPEYLDDIAAGRQNPGKRGVGIRNVDERFKLHFGGEYGIRVQSARNQGTKVIFVWPKITEATLP